MVITEETLRKIAGLAKIDLARSEMERLTGEMDKIVGFAGKLSELKAEDTVPTTHAAGMQSVYREDVALPSFPREEMLANAPERDETGFLVPKVLD